MNQNVINVLVALQNLESPQEVEELQTALISVGVKLTYIRLTPLALDGGDSAASEQLSTPEVLSTLQGESTPAHRK